MNIIEKKLAWIDENTTGLSPYAGNHPATHESNIKAGRLIPHLIGTKENGWECIVLVDKSKRLVSHSTLGNEPGTYERYRRLMPTKAD